MGAMPKARGKEGTSIPTSTHDFTSTSSPSLISKKCGLQRISTRWYQRHWLMAALPLPGTKWGTEALLFTEKSQSDS